MKNGGKLSTLEIKVQALEADKGTYTSEAPAEPAKRKRRTPLCLQVCQAKFEGVCKTSSGIEVHCKSHVLFQFIHLFDLFK